MVQFPLDLVHTYRYKAGNVFQWGALCIRIAEKKFLTLFQKHAALNNMVLRHNVAWRMQKCKNVILHSSQHTDLNLALDIPKLYNMRTHLNNPFNLYPVRQAPILHVGRSGGCCHVLHVFPLTCWAPSTWVTWKACLAWILLVYVRHLVHLE